VLSHRGGVGLKSQPWCQCCDGGVERGRAMEIYTIGFTQKSAGEFFGALCATGITRLIDIRLNNSSQLAGFSKRDDLAFFLRELCDAGYIHDPLLAPTPELFDAYKKRRGAWAEYERGFLGLMAERRVEDHLSPDLFATPTVLLCSEPTPDRCPRRLVVEYLGSHWGDVTPRHL
jgi:uncharacterized protein (DUF488 family)